jgi:hypothetical protein
MPWTVHWPSAIWLSTSDSSLSAVQNKRINCPKNVKQVNDPVDEGELPPLTEIPARRSRNQAAEEFLATDATGMEHGAAEPQPMAKKEIGFRR